MCAWSLLGKVLPWLYEDYGRIARLRGPVGYWNSLALLGDIALPLGLCLATRMRTAGTLLVYGWIVAIGLTYSRGGIVVAVVVVALWMAFSHAWVESLATLLAAGVPAAGTLIVAVTLSGVTSDGQPHTTRVHDGLLFGAVLLLNGAIAYALARFEPPEFELRHRGALLALAVLIAAGVIVVAALHAGSWWNGFTSTSTTEVTNAPGRLTDTGSNHRWPWWTQAWRGWKTDPLAGTGAGSFGFTNLRYRTTSLDQALEPHDLPLQFLSETGVVGFALFVGGVGWLIVRSRRRPGPELALALALPAYVLHGLLDIGWDFAAVSAPVFLIAGALATRPSERPHPSPAAVLMASGAALAIVFSLFAVWFGDRWTGQAEAEIGDRQRTGGRSRAQGPFGQPAPRRARFSRRPTRRSATRSGRRRAGRSGPRSASRSATCSRRRDCSPTTPRPGTRSGTSTSSTGTARGLRCLPSAASRC